MTRASFLPALLLPLAVFAGCLEGTDKSLPDNELPAAVDALLAGPSLWQDPQNAPHPAYGWPTLSAPSDAANLPGYWQAIQAAPLPNPIKGIDLLAKSPSDITKGGGIAIFGSLLIVPGYGNPTGVLDISDPSAPKVLSTFKPQEGMSSHRGATTIAYPDGRLVTVISTGTGLDVWDLTDPTQPEPLTPIKVPSHKVGVVPGTPIVYNAPSDGGSQVGLGAGPEGRLPQTAVGTTEIYDLSDPMNPVKVQDWKNGYGCHHVYFWNDAAKQKFRGVCAGIEFTQIWDTADPKNPKVIVNVPVHHGVAGTPSASLSVAAFAHFAGLSRDGNILLVGDEHGGGAGPIGCGVSANTPQGAASTPIGALWFYDVKDEKNPRLLGWYSPSNDPRVKGAFSCTAHHGRLVPAEGRDMIAMSFYGAGVILIDFTGIGTPGAPLPKVVDTYTGGTNVWETWYNQGYLFTGDLSRGVDVLKFV